MADLSDLAKLPAISRFIERCIVTAIPAGALPKDITIQLPDADGAKIPVRYTGFPPGLAVNDKVSIRATPQDTIRYVIDGTSGATAPKVGKQLDHVLFVSTTAPNADHATIAAANTAASAGDIILLDAETWGNAIITKAVTLMGLDPVNTILTTTGTKTINVGADGVTLRNLTAANTGTSAHSCIESVNDNLTIQNCIINKVAGSGSGESRGIYNSGGDNWIIDNCRVTVTDGATKYGYHADSAASSAKIIGGSYEGSTDDINLNHASASVELNDPVLVNDDLNVAAGSWIGTYVRGADGLRIPFSTMAVRVYNSVNIATATGVFKLLTFDTERYDTDSMHSTVSNTDRLTANKAGYYLATLGVEFAANATGDRAVLINHNTAGSIGLQRVPAATATTVLNVTVEWKMAAGDYLTAFAWQTSGGALNVLKAAGGASWSPEFMMRLLLG